MFLFLCLRWDSSTYLELFIAFYKARPHTTTPCPILAICFYPKGGIPQTSPGHTASLTQFRAGKVSLGGPHRARLSRQPLPAKFKPTPEYKSEPFSGAQALLQIPAGLCNLQKPVAHARSACSAPTARIDLCMTSVKILSGSHAHKSPNKQPHPVVRIVTMRPAPFSGDASLMKTLPLADSQKMNCPAKSPCSAASLLCPFRVARVSRLIGNSHTTVNSIGWQANFEHPGASSFNLDVAPKAETQDPPNARNATPIEWRFTVLRLSLASQKVCGRQFLPPYLFSPSRPVCLYSRTAALAVALAGWLVFFGLVSNLPAPVHHWHLTYSNRGASRTSI